MCRKNLATSGICQNLNSASQNMGLIPGQYHGILPHFLCVLEACCF